MKKVNREFLQAIESQAEQLLRQDVLQLVPFYQAQSDILMASHELEQATAYKHKALRLRKSFLANDAWGLFEAHNALASLHRLQGQLELAISHQEQAILGLARCPQATARDIADAYTFLAELFLEDGQHQKARQANENAMSLFDRVLQTIDSPDNQREDFDAALESCRTLIHAKNILAQSLRDIHDSPLPQHLRLRSITKALEERVAQLYPPPALKPA